MLVAWLPDATSHTQATPQVPVTNISDNVKTVEKKTSVGAKQGNILTFLKPAQAKPEKKGKGKAGHLRDQPEKTATKRSAENAELTLDDKEQVAPKKPASKRKFLQQWQEEFTWVVFDKDDNKMTCKICTLGRQDGICIRLPHVQEGDLAEAQCWWRSSSCP